MSLIRQQQRNEKQVVNIRLPQDIANRLALYSRFIESGRDHVIGEALRLVFERDKEFTAWMKEHSAEVVEMNSAPVVNRRGRPKKAAATA
ncbi:MAG: hypothetical protein ABSG25_12410 [Bryobacteraceae bacterium]